MICSFETGDKSIFLVGVIHHPSIVDGIGAAAATSGVLSQLLGLIFALLYLSRDW